MRYSQNLMAVLQRNNSWSNLNICICDAEFACCPHSSVGKGAGLACIFKSQDVGSNPNSNVSYIYLFDRDEDLLSI